MPDSHARLARPPEEHRYWLERALERTTGFETATPTLAMAWRMSHASPPVSPVLLSCAFFAAVSSVSPDCSRRLNSVGDFVGAFPPRPTDPPKEGDHPTQLCRGQGAPAGGSSDPPLFGAPHRLDGMNGLIPTIRKVIAMPARRSKTKSATRKKTAARKTTVAVRRPAARRKPAAKKATTRRKTAARRKPATKTSEQLGAPLPPLEPIVPVADPSLIREEPTPQPASPLPEMEKVEERGLSTDFSEREEELEKD